MKRIYVILCTMMLFFVFSTNSYATLNVYSDAFDYVAYDDVVQQYWIWEISAFSDMTYEGQVLDGISSYNDDSYFGLTDWHMASYKEMQQLWLYTPEDIDLNFGTIYYKTDLTNLMSSDTINDASIDSLVGACVTTAAITRDGSAPEPATIFLLSTGLAGLIGFRKKFKK